VDVQTLFVVMDVYDETCWTIGWST